MVRMAPRIETPAELVAALERGQVTPKAALSLLETMPHPHDKSAHYGASVVDREGGNDLSRAVGLCIWDALRLDGSPSESHTGLTPAYYHLPAVFPLMDVVVEFLFGWSSWPEVGVRLYVGGSAVPNPREGRGNRDLAVRCRLAGLPAVIKELLEAGSLAVERGRVVRVRAGG